MTVAQKYALVTGASSGIGRHIAYELAMKGYPVIAVSNQPDQLARLKEELEQACGVTVHTLETDLARDGAAREVFDRCESDGLEVEVLVNNAGMLVVREVVEVDYTRASAILQLHVNTPALLCRLFAEKMAEQFFKPAFKRSILAKINKKPTL